MGRHRTIHYIYTLDATLVFAVPFFPFLLAFRCVTVALRHTGFSRALSMIARVTVCPRILLSKCTPRKYISRRNLFSSAVRLSDEAPLTGEVPLDSKAYSKTLLLPKTSFPLWSNPPEVEDQYRSLTCDNLYQWQVREVFGCPVLLSY